MWAGPCELVSPQNTVHGWERRVGWRGLCGVAAFAAPSRMLAPFPGVIRSLLREGGRVEIFKMKIIYLTDYKIRIVFI